MFSPAFPNRLQHVGTKRPAMRVVLSLRLMAAVAAAALAGAIEGRAADDATCLECHSDATLTTERAGKTVSLLVEPAKLAASKHTGMACADCHEGFDATAIPHREPIGQVNCLGCHEDLGKSHAFHPQIGALREMGTAPEVSCAGCHGGHDIVGVKDAAFRFTPARQSDSCGACHADVQKAFVHSAHAGPVEGPYPSCLRCHSADVVDGTQPALELKKAQSRLCLDCHVDSPEAAGRTRLDGKFVASWGASVHGRALDDGKAEAANCVDCHGSHEMARGMMADSRVNKLHIPETCERCHQKESHEYLGGSHAAALKRGELESPVCTDCHGEHAILGAKDPDSPVAPRNLSQQLCGDCHGSVKLSRKYGIASDRFETFADSFHGLSVRGGSVAVVNCASCHGAHGVLRSSDPASPVHKANLVKTCGQCHPGANEQFSLGAVHVSLSPGSLSDVARGDAGEGSDRVVQIIATIYVWAIFCIVGGMFLHNALDFLKKVRRKVYGHVFGLADPHVPHRLYVRMTVNERLQHGILALSFIVLVVTGFMLRFPEAWWVVGLRNLSSSFFELRGLVHRIAGIAMIGAGVWHGIYIVGCARGRQLVCDLWPRWNDLADMWGVLRFNLGLAKEKPRFGRFSYMEKAEYWALMWGAVLMTVTGALLWVDELTMGAIGKLGFDIARVVHYYEAILATLSIIVWHFYFVIFNPEVYPMNLSWLTGRLSEEEMAEEHPLELERIKREEAAASGKAPDSPEAKHPDATPPPQ
jgi:cytochrome b subunit of formate dehydrogenase